VVWRSHSLALLMNPVERPSKPGRSSFLSRFSCRCSITSVLRALRFVCRLFCFASRVSFWFFSVCAHAAVLFSLRFASRLRLRWRCQILPLPVLIPKQLGLGFT
jgi:hypothetical protein